MQVDRHGGRLARVTGGAGAIEKGDCVMKEILADARRGATYVIPAAALVWAAHLTLSSEVLLLFAMTSALLAWIFAICTLVGILTR